MAAAAELRDAPGPASAPRPPVCLLRGCPPVSPRQRHAAISAAEDVGERGSEKPGNDADPAHGHVPAGSVGVLAGEFKAPSDV